MPNGGELWNAISMLPGVTLAFTASLTSTCPASPISYALLCFFSFLHHFCAGIGDESLFLLRLDLASQQVSTLFSAWCTWADTRGIIAISLIASASGCLNLAHRPQRIGAYMLNGIAVLVSAGPHPELLAHWLTSFAIFMIDIVSPNPISHGFFHFYAHRNMMAVWELLT